MTLRQFLCVILTLACASITSIRAEEHFDYDALGRLIRFVDEQGRVTTYSYDPAGNLLDVVTDAAPQMPPAISSVIPDFVRAGETKQIRISGSQLVDASVNTGDPKLTASVVSASATGMVLSLSATADAVPGTRSFTVSNAAGFSIMPFTLRPALLLSTVPTYIAVPPDTSVRAVTIRLSDADSVPLTFTIDTGNDLVVSVSPGSVTLNPGQTEFQLNIAGQRVAKTSVRIFSSALPQTAVFPIYITDDTVDRSSPLGVFLPALSSVQSQSVWGSNLGVFMPTTVSGGSVNNLQAADLGVLMSPPLSPQSVSGLSSLLVGVGFGPPQVMLLSPSTGSPGTVFSLTVLGSNLFDASAVVAEPGDGITFTSSPVAASDGTSVTVGVSIAANAASGPRVISVVSPAGTSTGTAVAGNTFIINPP